MKAVVWITIGFFCVYSSSRSSRNSTGGVYNNCVVLAATDATLSLSSSSTVPWSSHGRISTSRTTSKKKNVFTNNHASDLMMIHPSTQDVSKYTNRGGFHQSLFPCKSRIDLRGGSSATNPISQQQQQQHGGQPTPLIERQQTATGEAATAEATSSTTEESTTTSSHRPTSLQQETQDDQQQLVHKDEQHPEDDPKVLLLIRVLFFAYYASLGSLLPYLPVYYHSLGHGGQIIGMLGAIKPFTTFLVAPLWGVISDQTGSPFLVLYFTFLVSLLGQLMVAWRHDHLWIMVMVFLTAFFNAPVKSLLDSMVMSNLQDRSKYGRLRLWGQLGFGVGSSCVGYLLSQSRHEHVPYTPRAAGTTIMQHLDDVWQTITGYKLLFFSYMMLSIPTFVCIRAFDKMTRERQQLQQKENTNSGSNDDQRVQDGGSNDKAETKPSVLDGIGVLLHNSDAIFFFFLVLVVGVSSGVIENFAYVRIREVGGTGKEMGLCRLVSSLAGAPMFWFSGPLTELLGADRVIVVGLINYVVRYFNYAWIQSPLQALPAEALRGMTFAAFWSTCTIYATRIAPPGMQATMVRIISDHEAGCLDNVQQSRIVIIRFTFALTNLVLRCVSLSLSSAAHVPERNVWWSRPIIGSYHWWQTPI
jgi:MFS_1 like family